MKKNILTAFLLLTLYFQANATIHVVTVSDFQFSPQNMPNVLVGDTIDWIWSNGFHTTTSLNIPAGAASWNSNITENASSFRYIVRTAGNYTYECIPHSPGMNGSFTATGTLPVVLSEFKAAMNGTVPVLKWTTSSEQNTAYFAINRSMDGSSFGEIGRVEAAGNSSTERSYNFTDKSAPAGTRYLYYYILTVDKDGKTQQSPTRLVVNGESNAGFITSLTPNPIARSGHLMLKFNAEKDGVMEAMLSDMQGKSILKSTLSAFKGINNGHVHLGELPAGTYNLVFMLNGLREVHRIVIK